MIKSHLITNFTLPLILQILIMLIMIIPSKKINPHPINLMIMLMILTILICVKMNFMKKSLIPYMLFLTQIGGIFIILIYMISLTNNNFTKSSLNDIFLSLIKLSGFFFLLKSINLMYNLPNTSKNLIFNYYNMNINNLFNYNFMFTLFIMIYLLFSMICIMNICNKYKSPFRQLYLYV